MSGAASVSASQQLCFGCGLCCNGALFPAGELVETETVEEWSARGLDCYEREDRRYFAQSCSCFAGGRCSIFFDGRPSACRSFRCRPLRQFENGKLDLADARDRIGEAVRLARAVEIAAGKLHLAGVRNFGDLDAALERAFADADKADAKRDLGQARLALENFTRFAVAEMLPDRRHRHSM